MAFTHSWQMLLLVRIFFGIGIGLKGSTTPVYSAEVAPTVIRGALGWSPAGWYWVSADDSDGLAAVDDVWDCPRLRYARLTVLQWHAS